MPKRREYSLEELEEAISAVKRSRLTASQASRYFGIPRKTIQDHVNGRYDNHNYGPTRMLDVEEEVALVEYMKYLVQQGFPMTRAIVRRYIISIARKKKETTLFNTEKGPSDKWFRKFFQRYPNLTERVPERQDRSRARMANEGVMKSYFGLLEDTVKRLNLQDDPGRIFNCDETGWNGKEKSRQKVIGVKGIHTYQQALSSSGHITAHLCISGDGRVLPTFIVFEKCLPHTSYKEGVPPNWMFGYSGSGYMDSQLFFIWFRDLFIPNCGRKRPVPLVMDNHDSHINLELVKLARENGIELLGLPPHTTHILQPLNVGINGPLKAKFSSIAVNLGHLNKHQVLNKTKYPVVLSYAIDLFCSPAKVKGAFRKSGLVPVNPDGIDKSQVSSSQFTTSSANENPSQPSTSAVAPTAPKSSSTCATCGSFLGGNPLVTEGLIPESLAAIFPPVPSKPQTARRKVITEGRVITSYMFFKQLEERREQDERRKNEMAMRKAAREERRKQKEEDKQRKASKAKAKKVTKQARKQTNEDEDEDEDEDDDVCCICNASEPPCSTADDYEDDDGDDDIEDIPWIQCDTCEDWFHKECLGLSNENMEDVYFVCTKCCQETRN